MTTRTRKDSSDSAYAPSRRLRVVHAPRVVVPDGLRPPFAWPVAGVTGGDALRLVPIEPGPLRAGAAGRLRLVYGLDCRESLFVGVRAGGGEPLGTLDLRVPFVHQPIDLPLPPTRLAAAARDGVELCLRGGAGPAWFFAGDGLPHEVGPRLLIDPPAPPDAASRVGALRAWLRGPGSLQQWGWRLGCVLDALTDLGEPDAVASHLGMFLGDARQVVREDPRSRPATRIYGVEETLPFAHLVRHRPDHPALDECIAYWLAARDDEGNVGGPFTSAEGSYTVAYPMAVVGLARGRDDLIDLALHQLRLRRDKLRVGDDLYLRLQRDGSHTFRNWCRGCAWYLLGLVRTLAALQTAGVDRPPLAPLRDEARAVADLLRIRRLPAGLWANFVGEPDSAPDTSGSAGIAAALAIGARHGLLPAEYLADAARTRDALTPFLLPDGLLAGAAQDNRGGEALQRSDYRVIHPAGAGLFGQLLAHVPDA